MRIDWDAYERNQLPPAEMAEVKAALKADPDLRAEYRAFQSFKNDVRASVKTEPVPMERLRYELQTVARPSADPHQIRRWGVVFVAGAALLVAMVARQQFDNDPLRFAKSPEVEQLAPRTEDDAWRWLRKEAGYSDVTPVQFKTPGLKFSLVRKGEDWACMDYILDGDTVRLYMKKDETALRNVAFQSVGNRYLYIGNGIGWRTGGFVFAMQGTSNEKLLNLLRQAS